MTTRRTMLLGLTALAGSVATLAPGHAWAAEAAPPLRNTLTLRDASGSGAKDYPLRIGRPFVQGEIPGMPQAVIGGARLPTQANVMTRWPDGSVQHAVLSFVVPQIKSGGSVTVEFVNQPAADPAPLGAAQMLDAAFDFDAVIDIAQGSETRSASARAMLQAGDFTAWCQGPIAQTVVIGDHSAARKYDIGFDDLRSIRPLFHATFWPGLRKVQVRVIGENANTETLQDVKYALSLKGGAAKRAEMFRQDSVPHYAATRWTRTFWLGGAPNPNIDIDHNLRYLAATRAFPNFDTSLKVPPSTVASLYANWQKAPKGLYDGGGWTKYMPTTGGRDDIGPYPGHVAIWLFTGDRRMFEIVSGMADLAGAWPIAVREGNPAKTFDAAGKVPGLGRPLSVFARPSLWLFDERDAAKPADRIALRGDRILTDTSPRTNGGWVEDGAHGPDPFSALYTLTGDLFALEQMQFSAASDALKYDPGYKGIPASGIFFDQVRGCAWVIRNRVHAAFLSPDAMAEKPYLKGLVDDAIAAWEGRFAIHGSPFDGNPAWRYGNSRPFPNPLHFFSEQPQGNGEQVHLELASTATQLWQHFLLMFELGRSKEKGFPSGPLLSWMAELLTGQFTAGPAYSPYNLRRYVTPVRRANGEFFQTWADTLPASVAPVPGDPFNPDVRDGYATYAYAASTMIAGEPGGAAAYAWLRAKAYEPMRAAFAEYPKWAFLPRA